MIELTSPYWYDPDGIPALDFNREIVEPGQELQFPDGAMAIRVDDDFWVVASLPLAQYRDIPIEQIVAEYWPTYVEQATYAPDHGTPEQQIYFLETMVKTEEANRKHLQKAYNALQKDHDRLKADRTGISPRRPTRLEAETNYFVRQYEHLLTAMAHEGKAIVETPGICSICGLYINDRVHSHQWLEKHRAGYDPDMEWAGNLGNER